jgi:hypothetical protein
MSVRAVRKSDLWRCWWSRGAVESVAPACDGVVGLEAAGMEASRCHVEKLAVGRGRAHIGIEAPALYGLVGMDAAVVPGSRADLGERTGGTVNGHGLRGCRPIGVAYDRLFPTGKGTVGGVDAAISEEHVEGVQTRLGR